MSPPSSPTGSHGQHRLARRTLLATGASLLPLAGCLSAPSSSMPPFEAYEIDDGPVYGPGLEGELEMAFFAGLVAEESGADRFDLEGVSDPGAAGFLAETDFATQLLGVIQVAGVNSSMHFDVVDLALTPVNLTAVVALRDEPPHSDDRVITTFLIRVPKRGDRVPDQIWVELSIDGREETFSGKRPGSPD